MLGNCTCAGQGNTIVSHFVVQRADLIVAIACVPCGLVWFSVALRPQRRVGLLGTGTEWEGGERVKGSTAETARKRPERPWTAARTMEVLRRCPLAIAQRLVHCANALSTVVLDRVTKTMSVAPLLTNNLDNSKQKTFSYLCVRVRILGVLKIVCCCTIKTCLPLYACCGLHFY